MAIAVSNKKHLNISAEGTRAECLMGHGLTGSHFVRVVLLSH